MNKFILFVVLASTPVHAQSTTIYNSDGSYQECGPDGCHYYDADDRYTNGSDPYDARLGPSGGYARHCYSWDRRCSE